ncbi:hypothetical protein D779_1142 [Imhoffiella purpurea]|uniref:Uncharacterized protein n=1 Tax=Imhoffiella purpurea TaxID=1249627 RepID=W9VZ03_9GAMM|nr:hypothetical protein D779_1142 [Imhoffiella purpurea]
MHSWKVRADVGQAQRIEGRHQRQQPEHQDGRRAPEPVADQPDQTSRQHQDPDQCIGDGHVCGAVLARRHVDEIQFAPEPHAAVHDVEDEEDRRESELAGRQGPAECRRGEGEETEQAGARRGTGHDHTARAIPEIAPEGRGQTRGQPVGDDQTPEPQQPGVGLLLREEHVEGRSERHRQQQTPGDHEAPEREIVTDEPQLHEGQGERIPAPFRRARLLADRGEQQRGQDPHQTCGGQQTGEDAQTAPLEIHGAEPETDPEHRETGQTRAPAHERASAALGHRLAEHVLGGHRAETARQAEDRQHQQDPSPRRDAVERHGDEGHAEETQGRQQGAQQPDALANGQAPHRGGHGQLRHQHPGLANRHQQCGEGRRHAQGTEEPGDHELGAGDLVRDLGEQVGSQVGEEIVRLVVAGILGDILADPRILISGDTVVERFDRLARGQGVSAG